MNISINLEEVVTYCSLIGLIMLAFDNYLLKKFVMRNKINTEEFILDQLNFNFGTLMKTEFDNNEKKQHEAVEILEKLFSETHSRFDFVKKELPNQDSN